MTMKKNLNDPIMLNRLCIWEGSRDNAVYSSPSHLNEWRTDAQISLLPGNREVQFSPPQRLPRGGGGLKEEPPVTEIPGHSWTKSWEIRKSKQPTSYTMWWELRGIATDSSPNRVNLRITSQLLTGRNLGQLSAILLFTKPCFHV